MAVMAASELKNGDQAAFEAQAGTVLQEVRGAMAGVIAAIPGAGAGPLSGGGGEIRTATDLQRILGIRKTLAWQIFRIAYATDPLAEGGKVPGKGAMRRFFDAATAQGVSAEPIESASAALRAFGELVKTHAGDRSSFASLLSSVASEGGAGVDLQHKRSAFRSNSHLWGLQAKAQLKCWIMHPAADPDLFDYVVVYGYLGFHRSRPISPLILFRDFVDNYSPEALGAIYPRAPLCPGDEITQEVSLLRSFCSDPLPQFRATEPEPGVVQTELLGTGIGKTSAVSMIFGQVWRNVTSPYAEGPTPLLDIQVRVRLPAEVLVQDVLIHEETFGPVGTLKPNMRIYGSHGWDDSRSDEPCSEEANMLHLRETVIHLGKGPAVVHSPDVPRLAEMVEYACEQLGWDVNRFDAYRCRVEYPVMSSKVTMRFELPERP